MNAIEKNKTTELAPAAEQQEARLDVFPSVVIFEDQDGHVLEAEMPGAEERNVRVTIEGRTLTVEAENAAANPDGYTQVMREIEPVRYRAVMDLPERIDPSAIKASFKHGVLRVDLPHRAETKARRIAVAAA